MYNEFRSRGMLGPWAVVARVHAVADDQETRRANALLIAAAPDLLDALEDLLQTCISRGNQLGLDDGGPVLDLARTALARARGEVGG